MPDTPTLAALLHELAYLAPDLLSVQYADGSSYSLDFPGAETEWVTIITDSVTAMERGMLLYAALRYAEAKGMALVLGYDEQAERWSAVLPYERHPADFGQVPAQEGDDPCLAVLDALCAALHDANLHGA